MINGVAAGTFIAMSNGLLKAVENIKLNEEVLTLEGNGSIIEISEPIVTKCVKLIVKTSYGDIIGFQINSIEHEALTKEYDWRSCSSLGINKSTSAIIASNQKETENGKYYINPFTGEKRHISIKTEDAKIQFEHLGDYLVYGFKVKNVNNFITKFGIINASN